MALNPLASKSKCCYTQVRYLSEIVADLRLMSLEFVTDSNLLRTENVRMILCLCSAAF